MDLVNRDKIGIFLFIKVTEQEVFHTPSIHILCADKIQEYLEQTLSRKFEIISTELINISQDNFNNTHVIKAEVKLHLLEKREFLTENIELRQKLDLYIEEHEALQQLARDTLHSLNENKKTEAIELIKAVSHSHRVR